MENITAENFGDITYEYLNWLSLTMPKDEYNALAEHIFKLSAQRISRKDKIKVGFVLYDSSIWCGDELYNCFARDERFEVAIFLCLRTDKMQLELIQRAFLYSLKQFQSRGLNVVAIKNPKESLSAQDILIFLTPYFPVLPLALRPANITAKTLIVYVPYGLSISNYNVSGHTMSRIAWRFFFTSEIALKSYDKLCKVGMPRGVYGGYPKADIFFDKDLSLHFDWKMSRPDAKKIIYAPHWSINSVINHATFHRNFKFMYEFAKSHSEISWVFKPHPNLFFSAVSEKVFPSVEAFKEYLQAWNNLPNALVYLGAYYQAIFATSDGMIHDSASFVAEYQFANKPMIFLTREGEVFNELGEKILKTAYLVDGRDFEGIVAMIQRVFIEGDDYKADERKKIFNKCLNYPKHLGMSASEFIFKTISQELGA